MSSDPLRPEERPRSGGSTEIVTTRTLRLLSNLEGLGLGGKHVPPLLVCFRKVVELEIHRLSTLWNPRVPDKGNKDTLKKRTETDENFRRTGFPTKTHTVTEI